MYSYQMLLGKTMTLEDAFLEMYDTGATCFELLTSYIEGYPNPSVKWIDNYWRMCEKYDLHPSELGHWAENHLHRGPGSTVDEMVEQLKRDFRLANLLGFTSLRTKITCTNMMCDPEPGWQEYIEKALMTFKEAGDPMYKSALGELALVYQTRRDWAKADSLYQEAIANSEAYPHAMTVFLSNYARMKLLQPDKDPSGAIHLLDRKRGLSEGEMTPAEVGAYAYASALQGDQHTCDALSSRLLALSKEDRKPALSWLYRIAIFQNDQRGALGLLQEMRFQEDGEINAILSESVTKALQDYYEVSARKERERRLRLGVWTLAAISLLMFMAILLLLRERQVRAERDRLLRIRAELEQDLKEQETRTSLLSDSFSSRLAQLRLQLKLERLERLRKNGQYGYWIWMEQKGRSSYATVARSLRKDLQEICALEKDCCSLECRLDKELDGIVSHLKADLNIEDRPKEVFFLCCWLIGLKPDMIAELLNLQMSNVYVKTHRLEDRIRRLGKAEYAPLVKE